jgi:hypothetical protein
VGLQVSKVCSTRPADARAIHLQQASIMDLEHSPRVMVDLGLLVARAPLLHSLPSLFAKLSHSVCRSSSCCALVLPAVTSSAANSTRSSVQAGPGLALEILDLTRFIESAQRRNEATGLLS